MTCDEARPSPEAAPPRGVYTFVLERESDGSPAALWAGGVWLEGQEFHPIVFGNVIELQNDAGISLQNEANPVGHNGAVLDADAYAWRTIY